MRDDGADGHPRAWQHSSLRFWDRFQLLAPWLLLAISTTLCLAWALPSTGEPFGTTGPTVLGLVAATAVWMLVGHTIPLLRGTLRTGPTVLYLLGLLALCALLIGCSDVFVVLAISGFFTAYLLRPWPLGVAGVLVTSVVLNGAAALGRSAPTPQALVELVLIVLVQTAAIGAGIVISARSEPAERRREELIAQLEDALHENAGLHAQLIVQARESGVKDERQRLAGEIHDTLAQGLAGIITQLQAAERSQGTTAERSGEHVHRALDLARSSLAEARRSVRALAPADLEHSRLPDALRAMATRWARDGEVRAQVEVTGEEMPLSPAIEESLFRVAQEALRNVAKHADASRVGVTLSYAGTEVLLDVRDDGRGFDARERSGATSATVPAQAATRGASAPSASGARRGPGAAADGFGLTSMRQRIRGLGGHLEVQSAPGEGTAVSARVPAIPPGGTSGRPADGAREAPSREARGAPAAGDDEHGSALPRDEELRA